MASDIPTPTFSKPALILDFDGSVHLPTAHRLDCQSWQESLRFSCRHSTLQAFEHSLQQALSGLSYGTVLLGSGDFHHLTYLLLKRLPNDRPIQLIVCDNHPDNMRYPLGIHCGSWVYWASQLPHVRHIHVLGIGSADISWRHSWENHLSPLLKKRVTYWSTGVSSGWLKWLGRGQQGRQFEDVETLLTAFLAEMGDDPVYLSLDKDVFGPEVVKTNWDQGIWLEAHALRLIEACSGRLVGADITGEVSVYTYQSRMKKILSALDGQTDPPAEQILEWQQAQNALNVRLLQALEQAWRK